jgi:hypothetical protein
MFLQITLAFQTGADGKSSKCVGISSYGTANRIRDGQYDENEHVFESDDDLMEMIQNGRVFELDMICSNSGSKLTGTLLMQYIIAKELSRKSRGGPKYDGVMISLARDKDGIYPLQNIAKRMGFKKVEDSDDNHDIPYFKLVRNAEGTIVEKLNDSLPDIREILKFCPIRQRTGITYCV